MKSPLNIKIPFLHEMSPITWYIVWALSNRTFKLDRTRRAWVAPARDGRYVLGQLRSRTAGVNLRSILDGTVKTIWMIKKLKKVDLFGVPANHSFTAQTHFSSAPWKSTVQILQITCRWSRHTYFGCFARFFRTHIFGWMDGHLIVWNSGFWIRSAGAARRRN